MKPIRILLVAGALALGGPVAGVVVDCAAFTAALPTAAELVSDAVGIISMIGQAVSTWFRSHPADPSTQSKIDAAIQRAQGAAVLGGQLLAGVQDATQGQTAQAFAAFATAYADLMALVAPLGIVPAQPVAQPTVAPVGDAGGVDGGVRAAAQPFAVIPVPLVVRAVQGSGR